MKLSKQRESGFTLFIAIVLTATLLLVSTGIITIAVREAFLTSANRHSQEAFYAADTALECAIYWDLKGSPDTGESAFSLTNPDGIECNGQTFAADDSPDGIIGGQDGMSQFTINFPPSTHCAEVRIIKRPPTSPLVPKTTIEALGYNDCDVNNPRRVQRSVGVSY